MYFLQMKNDFCEQYLSDCAVILMETQHIVVSVFG